MTASGVNSVTLSVSGTTAVPGTLSCRYEYISVTNETGAEIFVCTNGNAATVDGDFCSLIMPGQVAVLANMLPLWDQASTVIPAGSNNQWGQWKGGGTANPGVSVSVIAVSTPSAGPPAPVVVIQGAG